MRITLCRSLFIATALVTSLSATALAQEQSRCNFAPWECRKLGADRREIRADLREIRADKLEIRQDRRELRSDVREYREDRREGASPPELRADRREIKADRRELRNHHRELRQDRRDLRGDVRDFRRDRRDAPPRLSEARRSSKGEGIEIPSPPLFCRPGPIEVTDDLVGRIVEWPRL